MAFIYENKQQFSDIDAEVVLKHFHAWGISKYLKRIVDYFTCNTYNKEMAGV